MLHLDQISAVSPPYHTLVPLSPSRSLRHIVVHLALQLGEDTSIEPPATVHDSGRERKGEGAIPQPPSDCAIRARDEQKNPRSNVPRRRSNRSEHTTNLLQHRLTYEPENPKEEGSRMTLRTRGTSHFPTALPEPFAVILLSPNVSQQNKTTKTVR